MEAVEAPTSSTGSDEGNRLTGIVDPGGDTVKRTSGKTPSISLRPELPDDDLFLFDLYASTREEEITAWGWDAETRASFLDLQFRAQQGSYKAQYPGADHEIILADERPIGRLLVDRSGDVIVLVDVALLPASRGLGLGTVLLEALRAEAAETERSIRLQVLLTNPARRLYERIGFTTFGNDGVYQQMEWRPA